MIGQNIKQQVFRDTSNYYLSATATVSPRIIKFVQSNAGHSLLDFGCAAGDYCVELAKKGFAVKGIDVNAAYVDLAKKKGIDAHLVKDHTPFEDKSFDTVMSFEVLEHIPNPGPALEEMKRLARKNVLLTVPNCEGVSELHQRGLVLEHFSDFDHKNFFTPDSLRDLLKQYFPNVTVTRGDAINPVGLIGNTPVRLLGEALRKLGLIRPRFYFRLFAVASFE